VLGSRSPAEVTAAAITGGADVIQLRAKCVTSSALVPVAHAVAAVCEQSQIPCIINDHVDLAVTLPYAGVHIGQDDISAITVRHAIGGQRLIGLSTHRSEQGEAAMQLPVDYMGVGPVYATPTKPDATPAGLRYVRWATAHLDRPWVAIGGIDQTNIQAVLEAGATRVAVVRAVAGAPDPAQAARTLKQAITQSQQVAVLR
jgi:thiamine-phosphate pyrophosphorylase